ncbi:MAG: TatD family hydrolase [Deltaproteobacteria bacterium]|nr:TatD family hydrolase [Deltaproteobacteria bacterium]
MFIDSHAHLDMSEYEKDRTEVIERAFTRGIDHIVNIGIDVASSRKAIALARIYKKRISATIGLHPHSASEWGRGAADALRQMALEPEVVAYGEIGLDFYRNHSSREDQLKAFVEQLDLAVELQLPVVIHDREAHRETLTALRSRLSSLKGGVIHCFSGDAKMADLVVSKMNFYISIPGTVTYAKAVTVQDVVRNLPAERLLLETDAPFLAPVPFRGKRNEPAYVFHTARTVAEIKGMDLNELGAITSSNARNLFGLSRS